jgi:hypothetical protein
MFQSDEIGGIDLANGHLENGRFGTTVLRQKKRHIGLAGSIRISSLAKEKDWKTREKRGKWKRNMDISIGAQLFGQKPKIYGNQISAGAIETGPRN